MEQIKFSSVTELYNRVKPALECKAHELKKYGYNYIEPADIWNALKNSKWANESNLSLDSIVNDILNTSNTFFDDYVKNIVKKMPRNINLDNENLL